MVDMINNTKLALSSNNHSLTQGEKLNREALSKSIYEIRYP